MDLTTHKRLPNGNMFPLGAGLTHVHNILANEKKEKREKRGEMEKRGVKRVNRREKGDNKGRTRVEKG